MINQTATHPKKRGVPPGISHTPPSTPVSFIEKEIVLGKILAHKLTLLYAPHQIDLSAWLKTAVIPELQDLRKENLDVVYYDSWRVSSPLLAIKKKIQKDLLGRKKIAKADLVEVKADTLKQCLDKCRGYASEPLIVIFDRFEELFSYYASHSPRDFHAVINQLADVMTDIKQPVHLVFSIHAEYLAELTVFREKVPFLYGNQHQLSPLSHLRSPALQMAA
jgi:hypothetical protein